MKAFQDLKYVGEQQLKYFGNTWHCTCFATNYKTGEMEYVMQPPYYYEGEFVGYTNLDAYIVTREELEKNFKIVNKDGSLTDITHDEEKEKQDKKEIDEYFENMTDEEFKKLLK